MMGRPVEIENNVRGRDVFIIQPTCRPANENIMELLILIDVYAASAQRITAVMPIMATVDKSVKAHQELRLLSN